MNTTAPAKPTADIAEIKRRAAGRWPEIVPALTIIPAEVLDGRHHPCPKCAGTDRFRALDDFSQTGAVLCNQCFSQDNGDGIAAIQHFAGVDFKAAIHKLADYLGVPANGSGKAHAANGRAKRQPKKAADVAALTKGIKAVDHAPEIIEVFFAKYSQVKPPITPQGIRQCGGELVTWNGYRCIRLDGRAPIDSEVITAVVLLRVDGKPFPAVGKIGERKTHTVRGSVNSWIASGDMTTAETVLDAEGVTDLLAVASAGLPPGWVAVTNTAGAKARGKLPRPWANGKTVIVAGDADDPGVEGQRRSAAAYQHAGAEVLLGQLPYPVTADQGKDLRDWVLEGHKLADMPTVAVSAEEAVAWGKKTRSASDRPRICAQDQDLEKITAEAWRAVQKANDPERLFRYGGNPCRIERDDEGNPVTRTLDQDRMRFELARCVEWYKNVGKGDDSTEIPAYPPKEVVTDVLCEPNIPLPVLTRIVEAPVFAPDGTIQTVPGYHAAGRTFYAPAAGFAIPDVPDRPTPRDIETATRLVCDELLGDFPFIGQSERAHAVAMFLLPFARDLIGSGATPIHLFEKPCPGTGATLLVECLAYAAIGRPVPAMTEGRDEDEWRKRLTAKLRGGAQFMFIDNLGRRLDSATVSAAVTMPVWEDRVLKTSDVVRIPVRCVWIVSGNNPALSNEISRRTVRIRLDAKLDRPWLRKGFAIPNLREWVAENRGRLVWSALVLIRAWLNAGRPSGSQSLGMFETWAATIGGILGVARIPGFLGNLDDFYTESDAEGAAWRSFILNWWERFGAKEVRVSELWEVIKDDTTLPISGDTEQAQKIRLGKLLADKRDRVFSVEIQGQNRQLRVERGGQRQRAYEWRLSECGESGESIPHGPRAGAHAHAHAGDSTENTHTHSPHSPADCLHLDVAETPTHDGYVNRQCRNCGEWLPCQKAEETAAK